MSEKLKLEDQIRIGIRRQGLAYRTEECYVGWYKRYVRFHGMRYPQELSQEGVEAFLDDLALRNQVSAARLRVEGVEAEGGTAVDAFAEKSGIDFP